MSNVTVTAAPSTVWVRSAHSVLSTPWVRSAPTPNTDFFAAAGQRAAARAFLAAGGRAIRARWYGLPIPCQCGMGLRMQPHEWNAYCG